MYGIRDYLIVDMCVAVGNVGEGPRPPSMRKPGTFRVPTPSRNKLHLHQVEINFYAIPDAVNL